MHVFGFRPPGVGPRVNQGNMLVKTREWIGFSAPGEWKFPSILLSSKERDEGIQHLVKQGTVTRDMLGIQHFPKPMNLGIIKGEDAFSSLPTTFLQIDSGDDSLKNLEWIST